MSTKSSLGSIGEEIKCTLEIRKIFQRFGTPHFPCGAHAFESPNPKPQMALKTT
jgi:hypothetical protein